MFSGVLLDENISRYIGYTCVFLHLDRQVLVDR